MANRADDNETRFRRILRDNRRRVMGIARSYARPPDATDLFQEILLQVWKSLPRFEDRSSESTWVYRIALNTALTYRRNEAHRAKRVTTDGDGIEQSAPPTPAAEAGGEVAILRQFLSGLGEADRAIFLMYLDDLGYREIAEVTGLSVSNVGVKIHRLRRAFTSRYLTR